MRGLHLRAFVATTYRLPFPIDCRSLSTAFPPQVRAFELTLDIESLIEQYDKDGSGELDFFEFKAILG